MDWEERVGTGDLHLASLRWVGQTVRQVVQEVEHPWLGPMVVQAVWPADPGVEHPWVGPKVGQMVRQVVLGVEHP